MVQNLSVQIACKRPVPELNLVFPDNFPALGNAGETLDVLRRALYLQDGRPAVEDLGTALADHSSK